jgi:plastocyanin
VISALAASLALGLASAASAQPTVINVQLDEYKYVPMQIDLHAGQAYVFHLTNTGSKDHDLSAKAFFATVALDPATASKVKNGDIDVDEGESVDVAFTPRAAGSYEMHCTRPFHSMLGMKGQIVVH